ncbi:MAG: NAD(P)/FAD-dependent oxidoreductase [Planctomycetota bacterium]
MPDAPPPPDAPVYDAIVVGAGLAGLCCARTLCEAGKSVLLLEASDAVGGRIRTDRVDGFLLDRGFQVFNTAYEEARRWLDYDALGLRPFEPGALVQHGGRRHRLSDPWRRPGKALATAFSGAATLGDKLRIARLRSLLKRNRTLDAVAGEEVPTIDALRRYGFSDVIVERFFRPFLGGVFLEPELATSSRMFEFVFGLFGEGEVTLPAAGMQAIPEQIAAGLPDGVLVLGARVGGLTRGRSNNAGEGPVGGTHDGGVFVDGVRRQAKFVVIATDGPAADALLEEPSTAESWRSTTVVDFAADTPPIDEGILVLNGDGPDGAHGGPINTLSVPSRVQPTYAPGGQALVSASLLGLPREGDDPTPEGDQTLTESVRQHARAWFGAAVDAWRPLRVCRVRHALPDQRPPHYQRIEKSLRARERVFVCGDRCDTASINGAMRSGRRAAEAVLAAL